MNTTPRSNGPTQTVGNLWPLIKSWKWKSVEKCIAYGALLVSSTKGFDTVPIPNSIRGWLIGGSALIIAALHLGTDE
jgi:hypothetical protein